MLREKVEAVRESIQKLCAAEHIDAKAVKVLAATKTVPPQIINELPDCGLTLAGENRVQEFLDKYAEVHGLTWHFIGALQSNKVKYIIDKAELIHSLDRVSLADEIEWQAAAHSMTVNALIEVNIGGEQAKSGIAPAELNNFYDYCLTKKHIKVRGLMSVLPKEADENLYDKLYRLFEEKRGGCFDILSAGMSGDYLTAIKHGANLVRLGSIIFGKRS